MSNYKEKLDALVDYFRAGETKQKNFKLGMEMEHFIVDENNYRAITYYGENGVEGILNCMLDYGWDPIFEGEYLLGLKGEKADISLEPGGQLELSVYPATTIRQIDEIYRDFLQQLLPILKKKNKLLLSIAYQPVSSIDDIPLLPKKRYKYMYDYFNKQGKYAHHMMKGTASLQINIDYLNEQDFIKKLGVSYYLSPLIYYMFDNAPFFEGKVYPEQSVRSIIWDNCDQDRCGIIKGVLDQGFNYKSYADYILNTPAICIVKDGKLSYSRDKYIKDIFEPEQFNEIETSHFLTMVFPDIRLKKYLEIRMGDALPYPYNLGYITFWQGLLYNQENLDKLYHETESITTEDIIKIKKDIMKNGIDSKAYGKPLVKKIDEILKMAKTGLNNNAVKYLNLVFDIFSQEITPKLKTISLLNLGFTKKEALSWCVTGGKTNGKII